jgi:hypothetical protein
MGLDAVGLSQFNRTTMNSAAAIARPTIQVWAYGFHTITMWAFSREMVELNRETTRENWEYSHSPSEAMSGIYQIPLAEVQDDWIAL